MLLYISRSKEYIYGMLTLYVTDILVQLTTEFSSRARDAIRPDRVGFQHGTHVCLSFDSFSLQIILTTFMLIGTRRWGAKLDMIHGKP